MQLWACTLQEGPTKGKSTVSTMRGPYWDSTLSGTLGPGSLKVRLAKYEGCFLLPHKAQTGGTLFAVGFPDFFRWFVSEDKQSA